MTQSINKEQEALDRPQASIINSDKPITYLNLRNLINPNNPDNKLKGNNSDTPEESMTQSDKTNSREGKPVKCLVYETSKTYGEEIVIIPEISTVTMNGGMGELKKEAITGFWVKFNHDSKGQYQVYHQTIYFGGYYGLGNRTKGKLNGQSTTVNQNNSKVYFSLNYRQPDTAYGHSIISYVSVAKTVFPEPIGNITAGEDKKLLEKLIDEKGASCMLTR